MIWRIRDRNTFEQLRAEGRTARDGGITVRFLLDREDNPPRIGFAIPRAVGSAVTRNRIRRRSRAVLASAAQRPGAPIPSGAYLVRFSAPAGGWPAAKLAANLERVFDKVTASSGARSGERRP